MLQRKTSLPVSRPIGDGLYPVSEVARLLHVQSTVVRRWSHIIAGAVTEGSSAAARQTVDTAHGKQSAWSFLELIDLLFIQHLAAAGLSLHEIASLAGEAAARIRSDHPFATRRFKDLVTGSHVAKRRNGSNDARGGFAARGIQLAAILQPLFEKLEFNTSTHALRYWPLGRGGRVVLDPKRKFGRPIDAPTRVLTETLFDAVRAGGGQDASVVAEWFDVPWEAVDAALRFEQESRGK